MTYPTKQPVFFIYADDDRDDHDILATVIASSSYAYEMRSVYDGNQLISTLIESFPAVQPDFLLIDMNMPKMDGLTTISHLRKHEKYDHIPMFLFSTNCDSIDRQKTTHLRVTGLYNKPVKISDLEKIIEEITRKSLNLKNNYNGDLNQTQRRSESRFRT